MSKKTSTPKKTGRPTIYTKALAAKLCKEIASGKSLRSVCKMEKMPGMTTVFSWLGSNEDFQEQYARATEERTEAMAEEILDISDDGTNDWMEIELENGYTKEVLNHEHVQRSKLRIETRKFLMSKMKPKKYGDKLDLTSDGEKLATVPITGMKIVIEK